MPCYSCCRCYLLFPPLFRIDFAFSLCVSIKLDVIVKPQDESNFKRRLPDVLRHWQYCQGHFSTLIALLCANAFCQTDVCLLFSHPCPRVSQHQRPEHAGLQGQRDGSVCGRWRARAVCDGRRGVPGGTSHFGPAQRVFQVRRWSATLQQHHRGHLLLLFFFNFRCNAAVKGHAL